MIKIRPTLVFTILMAIGSASFFTQSCKNNTPDRMIIFTRTAANLKGDSSAYTSQCQIIAIDPRGSSLNVLSNDYYSAQSPVISYDGKHMLFSGKLTKNDASQIWEMNLASHKIRQVTRTSDNCSCPDYLPGERIVFSKIITNDTMKAGYSVFTCNLDGSNTQRITFNPADYLALNVMKDGRVLTIESQVYPERGNRILMVLRPDGTKAELFYNSAADSKITSSAKETTDGRLVFTEKNGLAGKGNIISISYNRPLHSTKNLSSEITGDFMYALPQPSGKLLVSYRKSLSERYGLYEFDPENQVLGKAIYADNNYNVVDVVVTGMHERPKNLPSEVDMGVKTGLLLCQDVSLLNPQQANTTKSSTIQIVGIDSILGRVDVESDGSFYLKVIADKPFRIQTIGKDGTVVQSTCGWISLRPNERRGCIGCHEDPELVPGNRVPLSVKKSPVNIPMHINKIVEKKVSLE